MVCLKKTHETQMFTGRCSIVSIEDFHIKMLLFLNLFSLTTAPF